MNFLSFPSIESFFHIVKWAQKNPDFVSNAIVYRGKVKLHGTNAGIRVSNSGVIAQSRSQIITPTSDNAGFARWVDDKKEFWAEIGKKCNPDEIVTFFGEWCGSGIMKGTSISAIGKKVFVIFAVLVNKTSDVEVNENENGNKILNGTFVYEPSEILTYLGDHYKDFVYVLPWQGDSFVVNYFDKPELERVVAYLNEIVLKVEACDPWVKEMFGIDGIGEGLVYYPTMKPSYSEFSHYAFKAKGDKHKVTKTKEAVQIDPELVSSINDFCNMFVTENRLEQGLAAVGEVDLKNVGKFLAWMGTDVKKESVLELEESGLDWNEVQKEVQKTARNWYIAKAKAI